MNYVYIMCTMFVHASSSNNQSNQVYIAPYVASEWETRGGGV